MTTSDAELIVRVLASDDRAAFAELLGRHQSAVRHFLRRLTWNDGALADDLAQETFIRAYRQLAHFHGHAPFSTWLLGIAHNLWRNARRRTREHEPLDEHAAAAADAAPATHHADLRHDLDTALRTLSADEQLAIHLAYRQGKSHREIADVLEWPLGTVKTHLARAKEKLRHQLAAWNLTT